MKRWRVISLVAMVIPVCVIARELGEVILFAIARDATATFSSNWTGKVEGWPAIFLISGPPILGCVLAFLAGFACARGDGGGPP